MHGMEPPGGLSALCTHALWVPAVPSVLPALLPGAGLPGTPVLPPSSAGTALLSAIFAFPGRRGCASSWEAVKRCRTKPVTQ